MTTTSGDDLGLEQQQIVRMAAARLHERFEGVFSIETTERFVRESLAQMPDATVRRWLPLLAERFAADRLRALMKVESLMTTEKPYVLFLCVQNAGRSQMAAGWLSHLAGDRVEVFSGGSEPGAGVNPQAVEAMAEVGIDISSAYPKPWSDEIVRAADVVVTMGCGDACPIFPGKRYEDWEVRDPAGAGLATVREVREDIHRRVVGLMASLDVPDLS